MAIQRVEDLLLKSTRALDAAGIAYAVVGGNAVAAWVRTVDEGAVRATKDVDVMVRRGDLAAIIHAMRPIDLEYHEVHGVSMFLDRESPSPKTGLHLLFANEIIRAGDPRPAPDIDQAVSADQGFKVIDLRSLLFLKLMAYRHIDKAHIQDLQSLELIDERLLASLPDDLRRRYERIFQEE